MASPNTPHPSTVVSRRGVCLCGFIPPLCVGGERTHAHARRRERITPLHWAAMWRSARASAERVMLVVLGVVLRHLWSLSQPDAYAVRRHPARGRRRNALSATGAALHTVAGGGSSSGVVGSASATAGAPAHWGTSTATAASANVPSRRPNIAIALLDDAGAGDAGALGHPLLRTPHIDAFAADAVAFSQAYAGAPNCSPSRASLLTGRASYRTGVYDFLSKSSGAMHLHKREKTIANLLRNQAGYATCHYGKWHLTRGKFGHPPMRFGFDHTNGSFLAASALLRNFLGWVKHGKPRDKPFFAYLALWEPHEPVHRWSPKRLQRIYGDAPAHGQGLAAPHEDGSARAHGRGKQKRLPALEELAPAVASGGGGCAWRLNKRNPPRVYYGCMSQVDESFGQMLDGFEALGVRENTLVMLTSDNGPEHREPNSWGSSGGLRGAKGYVYEGGIRIPLLIQWPAMIKQPFVVHEPIHQWDLLPTLCDVVGIAPPSDRVIDGVSLLGLLLSEGDPEGASTSTVTDDPAAAAREAETQGGYVRLRPFTEALAPPPPALFAPAMMLPLPRPDGADTSADMTTGPFSMPPLLERSTPLFWAMHRGRGGMQYAIRVGAWKLLAGYGESASRGDGPPDDGEVVPWLRTMATLGRVELYLLSHDPAERVDLSASQPHVVARLLSEMTKLLREVSRDGPDVPGWKQRSPPCPRYIYALNVTELCCQPLPTSVDPNEEAMPRWLQKQRYRDLSAAEYDHMPD